MRGVSPQPIHPFNPHFPPPAHHPHPPSWRPATIDEFNGWNQSPQGTFPSTLIGPGLNPDLLPRPQPAHQSNTGASSTGNTEKRKQSAPSAKNSPVGGFGPSSPNDMTMGVSSLCQSTLPLFPSTGRRNAASDVWAFARPLVSAEPLPDDHRLTPLEPCDASKPKTGWFCCTLCSEFGCVTYPQSCGGFF
jgi:hypothetical protein